MRRKTVLLVDDHEDSRVICSTILEHEGYVVLEAVDGESGLRLARAHLPDLVVMDVTLPLVDGWSATRALKQDASTAHIPVIALTAHALRADRDRAMALGMDAYLVKPCSPSRLLSEVNRVIGTASRER